ncbi:MAG: class I SAM-dependent methyltransferase, partial [Opitutae bacterium]|nr:class I SAM-dependent methyltransferase [Opitutae bacterium]
AQLKGQRFSVLHLPHGGSRTNWTGRRSPRVDDDVSWAVASPDLYWRLCYRSGPAFAGMWAMASGLKLPEGGAVVEVGTMLGDGASVLAAAFPEHRVITTDPGISKAVVDLAKHRTGFWPNVEMWSLRSLDAAKRFAEDASLPPVGLAYLDGSHLRQDVVDDIRAWRQLVCPGGFLCGHDYTDEHQGVVEAVDADLGKPFAVFCDGSWIADLGGPEGARPMA